MHQPLCVAEHLAQDGFTVRYQTSTRSPASFSTSPGALLRRGFEFPAPEGDTTAKRYLYNAVLDPDRSGRFAGGVRCDEPAGTDDLYWRGRPGRCTDPRRTQCGCGRGGYTNFSSHSARPGRPDDHTLTPPLSGPGFGSYVPGEVTWLLKDSLARGTRRRNRRTGEGHPVGGGRTTPSHRRSSSPTRSTKSCSAQRCPRARTGSPPPSARSPTCLSPTGAPS